MTEHSDFTNLPIFDDGQVAAAATNAARNTHRTAQSSVRERSTTMSSGDGRSASWPVASSAQDAAGNDGVNWHDVRMFRQLAADRLAEQLSDDAGAVTEERRREIGRETITQLLNEHVQEVVQSGQTTYTPDEQVALEKAIFDALFGLGRLQPLVDDTNLENIEVYGADTVIVTDADGRIEKRPPVADSDADLQDMLSFLASRGGQAERTFSEASPSLHLTLHGGHRLAAAGWTTQRTTITIRRHRLVDIDLDYLEKNGTLTPQVAEFLRAAVRARRSIVVAGSMGAGKTTLVRALANEINPWEKLGTIETEYELHLHNMPERHERIIAWEARPGSGERGPDGRAIGEITLDDLVYDALRQNLDRLIVGEVRGREVLPMFKAMQSGAGSLSTTHAYSARAAIERLVTCAMEAGQHVTETFAYRQIAEHIDLIVHIKLREIRQDNGTSVRRRHVDEVIALEPGEHGMPAITDVFHPGPDGQAVHGTPPAWGGQLADYGYAPPATSAELR